MTTPASGPRSVHGTVLRSCPPVLSPLPGVILHRWESPRPGASWWSAGVSWRGGGSARWFSSSPLARVASRLPLDALLSPRRAELLLLLLSASTSHVATLALASCCFHCYLTTTSHVAKLALASCCCYLTTISHLAKLSLASRCCYC